MRGWTVQTVKYACAAGLLGFYLAGLLVGLSHPDRGSGGCSQGSTAQVELGTPLEVVKEFFSLLLVRGTQSTLARLDPGGIISPPMSSCPDDIGRRSLLTGFMSPSAGWLGWRCCGLCPCREVGTGGRFSSNSARWRRWVQAG